MNVEVYQEAKTALHKAVKFDENKNYSQAIEQYTNGVEKLRTYLRIGGELIPHNQLRDRIEKYSSRIEELKKLERKVNDDCAVEIKNIDEDSIGNSYYSLFKRALNERVTFVEIEEPYLEAKHQLFNFIRFCEMLVTHAPRLNHIKLITKGKLSNGTDFGTFHQGLKRSLERRRIKFTIEYKDIHDREIRFDNGWMIKMGRGLDIYKRVDDFTLGMFDYDMRPCKQCSVHYYRPKT